MLLENTKNIRQQYDNDCLVACCKQVLGILGIEQSDQWLWRQLEISTGEGTAFTYVQNLEESLGLVVELHYHGLIEDFAQYIEIGLPIIVAVDADVPTEWPYYQNHAVVVIGFDDDNVYINDPAQPETGLRIDNIHFLHVWQPRDYQYAVIRLA